MADLPSVAELRRLSDLGVQAGVGVWEAAYTEALAERDAALAVLDRLSAAAEALLEQRGAR